MILAGRAKLVPLPVNHTQDNGTVSCSEGAGSALCCVCAIPLNSGREEITQRAAELGVETLTKP